MAGRTPSQSILERRPDNHTLAGSPHRPFVSLGNHQVEDRRTAPIEITGSISSNGRSLYGMSQGHSSQGLLRMGVDRQDTESAHVSQKDNSTAVDYAGRIRAAGKRTAKPPGSCGKVRRHNGITSRADKSLAMGMGTWRLFTTSAPRHEKRQADALAVIQRCKMCFEAAKGAGICFHLPGETDNRQVLDPGMEKSGQTSRARAAQISRFEAYLGFLACAKRNANRGIKGAGRLEIPVNGTGLCPPGPLYAGAVGRQCSRGVTVAGCTESRSGGHSGGHRQAESGAPGGIRTRDNQIRNRITAHG